MEKMCGNINLELLSAIRCGDLTRVKTLINSYGLSYVKSWFEGYVLLVEAIQHKRIKIAEELLRYGCRVNRKTTKKKISRTPLGLAITHGFAEIVEMLLHRGAKIHLRDKGGLTMLHIAVQQGNTKIIQMLLKYGANFEAETDTGHTPLCWAVVHGKEKIVKLFLTTNFYANINTQTRNGRTLLHIAARNGIIEIAKDLIYYGADINSSCNASQEIGYRPLHIACGQCDEKMVRLFLSKGADVNATTMDNSTPLHIAVGAQCEKVVKLLLEHGAKVDAQDKSGATILQLAVEAGSSIIVKDVLKYCPDINNQSNRNSFKIAVRGRGENYKEIVENLLQYGFIVNPEDVDSPKLLPYAVSNGYLKIVEDLLEKGADVNMLDDTISVGSGKLLHSAVINKQDEVAKLLVNYGANVNAEDKTGKTPVFYAVQNNCGKIAKLFITNGANIKDSPELLHSAAANGCLEVVEELLKRGFNVNAKDKTGRTPVFYAVERKDAKLTKLLLSNGIDVKHSYKILHTAVGNGCLEIVKELLKRGFKVNAEDKTGRTPVFYAVKRKDAKLTKLLLSNGADVKHSYKILHTAVGNGCLEVVEELLKCGADVNILDCSKYGSGGTPLHRAVTKMKVEVAKLLLNYGANVNAKDGMGKTPVFYAVQNNYAKITKLLLSNSGNIKDGPRLLNTAIQSKRTEIVDVLLQHGVDINVKNDHSSTPLQYATYLMSREPCDYYDEDDDYSYYDGFARRRNNIHDYSSVYIVELLKMHIAKLQVAGLYVNDTDLKSLINDREFIRFKHDCKREIEIMKCEKICNSYVSFYDIFTKNINQLAIYAKNENIVQAFKLYDCTSEFPMYGSTIEEKFRKALERKELMELSNQLFHSLFKSLPELPLLCIERIVSYFSNYDLKLLIRMQ